MCVLLLLGRVGKGDHAGSVREHAGQQLRRSCRGVEGDTTLPVGVDADANDVAVLPVGVDGDPALVVGVASPALVVGVASPR